MFETYCFLFARVFSIVSFPYDFCYLINSLSNNVSVQAIFDTVLILVEKLPAQVKASSEASQPGLCALLYILKELLHTVS
jgi:hypothetical protein